MKQTKNMREQEKRSARLRVTEKIAYLTGIKYNTKRYKFGGFFTTLQLEKILKQLDNYARLLGEIHRNYPDLKRYCDEL